MAYDGEDRFNLDEHLAALGAAAERIVPNRKKMSLGDAEDIVRMEFTRRGIPMTSDVLTQHAKMLHRGPFWVFLHPRQARREGIRFGWRLSKGGMDPGWVPAAVDDLANQEAWRQVGSGGPLAGELEPAECQRISKTEYFCVADVRASHNHPAYRAEIRISCRADGPARVTDTVLKQV